LRNEPLSLPDDHSIESYHLNDVPFDRISRLCESFTSRRVSCATRLSGGLSNSSFKILFESSDEPVVLGIYERDLRACWRELELLSLLGPVVPVPEVLHAEPDGFDEDGPVLFLRYVEGITFRELKARGDRCALQDAAYFLGAALATIGRQELTSLSHINDVRFQVLRGSENYLTSSRLIARAGAAVAEKVGKLIARWAVPLRLVMNERRLIHGDFRKQNILVRPNEKGWTVAAILDWECAFAGSPMCDVGLFLRYERPDDPVAEPAFSRGFRDAGGELCDSWFELSRVVDLESLCSSLTAPDLPHDIECEIVSLVIRTTVELDS
jgi:aminoglycoside phosphotransferase (APT) family kinase protein